MRVIDHNCQIPSFFIDSILYVSCFLTANVVILLTLSALDRARWRPRGRALYLLNLIYDRKKEKDQK